MEKFIRFIWTLAKIQRPCKNENKIRVEILDCDFN